MFVAAGICHPSGQWQRRSGSADRGPVGSSSASLLWRLIQLLTELTLWLAALILHADPWLSLARCMHCNCVAETAPLLQNSW